MFDLLYISFREIQLPSVLVQNCFADTQLSESDKSLMMEPFMTMSQKKMTVDVMMGINQSVAKEAAKTPVSNDEKFVPPGQDKSVETIDNRGKNVRLLGIFKWIIRGRLVMGIFLWIIRGRLVMGIFKWIIRGRLVMGIFKWIIRGRLEMGI